MSKQPNIQQIHADSFDVCIIGGGASGTGCALDATLRGLKVILVEGNDFASGTSSHSTKLIHGGVRYLEQAFMKFDFAQLRQVRHGLTERHTLLQNAPHLARPLALITPVHSWIEGLYYTIGLKIYGWFASNKDTLPSSDWLTKAQTKQAVPTLNPILHSAIRYYDGQFDDARYALTLALSAAKAGATVVNYTKVTTFGHGSDGKVTSAEVTHQITGEKLTIKAKLFLNCTGPHADYIRRLANPSLSNRIRPSKGVHITLPRKIMPGLDALLIPKTRDGRLVFAIPYADSVILGTTDDDYQNLEKEPTVNEQEVEYLLETLQPYITIPLHKQMVTAGFGGLRPLVIAANKQTKSLLRDHEAEHDPHSNLLSLLGGKWTTYRLMAKDAIDKVCQILGHNATCTTEQHILVGGHTSTENLTETLKNLPYPKETLTHLRQNYGDQAYHVIQIATHNTNFAKPILPNWPFIRAEIVYSVRCEMAQTIRDFLARRIRLEILDWDATAVATTIVGDIMATELGWSEAYKKQQIEDYLTLLASFKMGISQK